MLVITSLCIATCYGSHVTALLPPPQAILPLRGKILNVERKDDAALYKNAELAALIVALGLGAKGGSSGSGSGSGKGSGVSSADEEAGVGAAGGGGGTGADVLKGLRWVALCGWTFACSIM